MKVTFCGGAGVVTGANYLIETKKSSILVDCGMQQSGEEMNEINFGDFPYDPKKIDAVFITHAHIDHIGMIPKLVRKGFTGTIISTHPTRDLAEPLLFDAMQLLNDFGKEKGMPAPYEKEDIVKALELWKTVEYHQPYTVNDLEIEYFDAGHILGSAFIAIRGGGKTIVFSGDLGSVDSPFIRATEELNAADYVVIESTYGGRIHEDLKKRKDILEDVIEDNIRKKGTLLIPAFALERTQEMLFELNELIENKRVSEIPVFVDSPLAVKITDVYRMYASDPRYFNTTALALEKRGDEIFNFPGLQLVTSEKDSRKIDQVENPKIIIAGSGMSHGGRIVLHEKRYLFDEKNTVLFVGFQAAGSLGRAIVDGAKTVTILGEEVPVKASVKIIDGYSAHADQKKLMEWLAPARFSIKKVFIVQGEYDQAKKLSEKIRDELAISTVIPSRGDSVII